MLSYTKMIQPWLQQMWVITTCGIFPQSAEAGLLGVTQQGHTGPWVG